MIHTSSLRLLLRRSGLVLLVMATTLAATIAVTERIPATYRASSTLLVDGARQDRPQGIEHDVQAQLLSENLVSSFAEIARSRVVAAAALRELGSPRTADWFASHVSAQGIPQTQLLRISATAGSPEQAAALANAAATAVERTVRSLYGTVGAGGLTTIDRAVPIASPVSPNRMLAIVFGGVVGLLLGVGAFLGWERLDDRIRRGPEAHMRLGLAVLAQLPRLPRRLRSELAIPRHGRRGVAEPYRQLAAQMIARLPDPERRRILVTGPERGVGSSTVAAHLALALAECGQTVTLVEGAVRTPNLAQLFELDCLANGGAHAVAVAPRLRVTPFGPTAPEDPMKVLTSGLLQGTIAESAGGGRWVVIDTSALLPTADTSILVQEADAVLLVVRADTTTFASAGAARRQLEAFGISITGVIITPPVLTSGRHRHRAVPSPGLPKPAPPENGLFAHSRG